MGITVREWGGSVTCARSRIFEALNGRAKPKSRKNVNAPMRAQVVTVRERVITVREPIIANNRLRTGDTRCPVRARVIPVREPVYFAFGDQPTIWLY